MQTTATWLGALFLLLVAGSASAADNPHENRFATVRVDGSKIGNVHYTLSYDDGGEVTEVKTRASMSILGITVYRFTQDVHERWSSGELQSLSGQTDDDGDKFDIAVERKPDQYDATVNGDTLKISHDAFPNAVWHYDITEHNLLFNVTDLRLMKVQIKKSNETIEVDKISFDAERFDFTGDWEATLWFSQDKELLRFEYEVKGRQVVITIDQD